MSGNETEEVVGADNRVAFSIEGIALLHVGILGKDFKIFGQKGIILGHLICTLISENQGLEKLRSVIP